MKQQTNRILSILLTMMLLLCLLPVSAEAAEPVTDVTSITASVAGIPPVLGADAKVKIGDVTVNLPADQLVKADPDSNARYWKYSADGRTDWTTYYEYSGKTFTAGYWQCFLAFWIDSAAAVFDDSCVVTINQTQWEVTSVSDTLIRVKSPVYVLDSSGTVLTEIQKVSATCEDFPSLFIAGEEPEALNAFTTVTGGTATVDRTGGIWQVQEDGVWRDLGSGETFAAACAYRLKTTLKLPQNNPQLTTLGREVTLTVNGTEWTVDHDTMQNGGTRSASVTVYSHTVYAANEVCTVTFYDVNKPSGENIVGTVEAPGGEYILPECTFPSSHKDIIFDYWECEDIDGADVKKQPGDKILLLEDTVIYLYWKWKPGVNKVIFDAAVSGSYVPGIKAKDISISLEGGQHVSLVGSGYGKAYWLECGDEVVAPDTKLSTAGSYYLIVNFRLEDGFTAAFTEYSVTINSDVLGELACRTPVDQDDGSYIARFSLPNVPGTPISADQVTFTLDGYEVGKMIQSITPSVSTEGVLFNGSGYGKHENGCAYLVYMESDEAYVYYAPVYDSASFWASTTYCLDIWFTLEEGRSLPDSFWSDQSLVKEKFVLSGIEGAEVLTASRSSYGYYVRFKLPQLGNDPIGAVTITLDGYEAGKAAQDVVVTVSENISPFRYTPQEHYQNQHYYFLEPGNEDYDELVDAYTTLQKGAAYRFVLWLTVAKGYDASEMSLSDVVICTPYGDRTAKAIDPGMWDNSYKVTFDLPEIGTENPSYVVTLDPGEGTGGAFHKTGYYAGTSYTLPDCEKDIAFTAPEGMRFKAWRVGDKEMQPGETITITGHTLITALWRPYTSVTVTEIEIKNLVAPAAGAALEKSGIHYGTTADSAVYKIATRSWYDVTAGKTMAEGALFQAESTYRYTIAIKLKEQGYDQFAASAEDISVTLAGVTGNYTVEKSLNSSGTILMCKIFFECPAITGKIIKTGASARAEVTVPVSSGSGAILVVAQYNGGQMLGAQTLDAAASGTFTTAAFAHTEGCTYRAFLLDAESRVPLYRAVALPYA